MTRLARILSVVAVLALVACGDDDGTADDDTAGGDGGAGTIDSSAGGIDANPLAPDAVGSVGIDAGPGSCVPGATQCSDCVDNDDDGFTDGFDIECTGAADDDESGFATGIPGDNIDAIKQDCFFDGNSGGGDDGCDRHVCCILGLSADDCDAEFGDHNFDPDTDCPLPTAECIANCDALVPPGCDCFGCCTLCDGAGCVDVAINPTTAPDCDETMIHNPAVCPACVKVDLCAAPCGGTECILCPGQDSSDLPETCTMPVCPDDSTVCADTSDCATDQFCSAGCCISIIT